MGQLTHMSDVLMDCPEVEYQSLDWKNGVARLISCQGFGEWIIWQDWDQGEQVVAEMTSERLER